MTGLSLQCLELDSCDQVVFGSQYTDAEYQQLAKVYSRFDV